MRSAAKPVLRPGLLPGLLGYRLRLAQQAVFRDFAASISEVSPGRLGVLLLIEANPGVTQGRAAADELEKRSFVKERTPLQHFSPNLCREPAG